MGGGQQLNAPYHKGLNANTGMSTSPEPRAFFRLSYRGLLLSS